MGKVEQHQAVVVGAGSAGLATAAELQRRDFEVLLLERAAALGTSWRARYPELRLNSWRVMSRLQGLRLPRHCGRYPSRDDFVAYLERFAAHHRLRVRAGTTLERVDCAQGGWRLATSAGPIGTRYLVIATGWDAVADLPRWPGLDRFQPLLIHAAAFAGAASYRDLEVLVVGLGNSGIDIAGHLVRAGARVTVSMRTPPNLARRDILGLPGQPLLAFLSDRTPTPLADLSFALVQRLLFGDLSQHGIPRPPLGVYANFRQRLRNPAIDDGFVAALKQGHCRVVDQVLELTSTEVVLIDGTRLRPDAVICATGYRRGLEPLVGHLGVLRPDGVPYCHRGAPEHPAAPRLYFAGMWGQFSGQIRLGPQHARRIARAAGRDRRSAVQGSSTA